MELISCLITPNSQYKEHLHLIMSEEDIAVLRQFLEDAEDQGVSLPKVAKDLHAELWYMLEEVHEFNAYERLK